MKSETNQPKKDIVWSIEDKKYAVRNVPYFRIDAEDEEFLSIGVSVKLELIRTLMLMNKVPNDIDFTDITDLKFSN